MIEYTPAETCCGVRPTYRLLDQAMRDHFAACPGGAPEAPLIDWAWSIVGRPGGLFIDIGAHVGSWSLPFALAGMWVAAFEPNPDICALLQEAAEGNLPTAALVLSEGASHPVPRLIVHGLALSDVHGHATLTAPGPDGGMGSIVRRFSGSVAEVDVTTLDRFTFPAGLDVIKIDVEGAEVDVLRGGGQTIRQHRPVIFFECWEDERGQRTPELFAEIDVLGYRAERTAWPEMWMATPA